MALLLDNGAAVNATSANGHTALHFASEMPLQPMSAAAASLLLLRGADVHARDCRGRTALHAAALTGHAGVAALLVARGADLLATDEGGGTALEGVHTSRDECCKLDGAEWGGVVALLEALAKLGSVEAGARRRRGRGSSSWPSCCRHAGSQRRRGGARAARLLRASGSTRGLGRHDGAARERAGRPGRCGTAAARARCRHKRPNNYDDTPLHAAASEGRLATVKLLVASGADAQAVDQFGRRHDHATKSQEGE